MDKEKTHLIPAAIAQGTSQYGMQTFDQSIFGLFEQDLVSYEEALRWASNLDEFKLKVQGISTTSDLAREEMARSSGPTAAAGPRPSPCTDHAIRQLEFGDRGFEACFVPIPGPRSDADSPTAALKMLGRRELSERQVRQRLARRGYDQSRSTRRSRA